MHVLRIEHAVADFDGWKRMFDGDPIGRKQGGVRRYTVMRAVGDPNHALIDLEFSSAEEAERFLGALRELWGRVDVIRNPTGQVVEVVETVEY